MGIEVERITNPIQSLEAQHNISSSATQTYQDQAVIAVATSTFEQLYLNYLALVWLATQHLHDIHKIQIHDENLRMEYTKKVVSSYRSPIPVFLAGATILCGAASLAVTISPKGIFDLCKKVPGTDPLLKGYMPDKTQLEDLTKPQLPNYKKFGDDAGGFAKFGQQVAEQSHQVYNNFAQGTRTENDAVANVMQQRTNEWSRKSGTIEGQQDQLLAAQAKAVEEEARTKQMLSR